MNQWNWKSHTCEKPTWNYFGFKLKIVMLRDYCQNELLMSCLPSELYTQ